MKLHDEEISEYFNECARNGFMESFELEEKTKLRKLLAEWDIKPGQRILEPGCGSGRLTEYIARAAGERGKVYACDLSEEMIIRARKRKLPENVRFVCGSVEKIQTSNEYFDKAICFSVYPHFSDQSKILAEIHRVLKPG